MANRYDPYRTSDSVPPRGFGGTDPYYPGANPFADGGRGYDDPLSAREREVAEARRAMWEEALRRDAERRAQALPRGPVADPRYEQRDRTRPIEYDGISPDRYEISQAGVPRLTDKQRAFQFEAQQALDAGEDRAAMDAIADKYGLSPFGPKLDEAISLRDQGKARAVLKPPEGEPFEPTYFNSLSDTPFGQYWRSTANGLANGYLDEGVGLGTSLWTGQPLGQAIEEADRAKQLGAGKFHKTNFAGELIGAVTNEVLIGRALAAAKAAQKLGRAKPYIEELLTNGLYGAGENNDDRVGGMAREGALGVAGGEIGRRIVGGTGRVMRGGVGMVPEGFTTPPIQILRDRGMTQFTPGQNMGGRWQAWEEVNAPRAIAGAGIRDGLGASARDFNRVAFQDLSPEITEIGSKGLDQGRDILRRLGTEAGTEAGAAAIQRGQKYLKVLDKAVDLADGEVFQPEELNRASAALFGNTATRPFYELGRAGQAVFHSGDVQPSGPSTLDLVNPKKWFEPWAATLLYSDSMRPIVNDLIVKRAPKLREAGEALIRNRNLGGRIGAPLLAQNGPEMWQQREQYGVWPYVERYWPEQYLPPIVTNHVIGPED